MKFGISQNGSQDLVEYPINQVKNVLHREASNVRYFENLRFLFCCYDSQKEAEDALRSFYDGKPQSLPPIKLNLIGFNANDLYANKYGTTNFDVFSIYAMNLCSLLSIQKFLNDGNSYQDIKDHPKKIKKLIYKERDRLLTESVMIWRNKVAAHYAAADPRNDDNLITLMDSLAGVPTYSFPRYAVSAMNVVINGESSQLKEWSVTKVYEDLSAVLDLKPLTPLLNTLLVGPNGEKDPLLTHS